MVVRAPTSGRLYRKPGPDRPPFVEVGSVVEPGATLCLLEVMKTFHRVAYGGDGLPARARVVAFLVDDEADVDAGDPIVQVEPA
ncbi:MAG: biotin carboxyl carrier domain-containing protein [Deltaproteobacteria bacterium]|nr:MAG: biotin carboxyl carrier domain-containing protein [Deltaproteobacteria bacterium]